MGKCSQTNITNSFAVGNLSSDEVAGALIGNTEYTYYVSDCFACNSQKIVAPSVINTGVKAFYDADVFNTADFFRFKISWNNPLWNTADLDFANGKYPTLIPQYKINTKGLKNIISRKQKKLTASIDSPPASFFPAPMILT